MKHRLAVGGLALAAIGVTCGGDGSTFSSGVDKEAELGGLSSGDAQKVCESLGQWLEDNIASSLKEVSCRSAGYSASARASAAQKQAACTAAYDECMKAPSETTGPATCEKPPSGCKATVGELESCINEMGPLMRQVLGSFPTCAQIATGSVPTAPGNLQKPAPCVALETKCEDFDLPSLSD